MCIPAEARCDFIARSNLFSLPQNLHSDFSKNSSNTRSIYDKFQNTRQKNPGFNKSVSCIDNFTNTFTVLKYSKSEKSRKKLILKKTKFIYIFIRIVYENKQVQSKGRINTIHTKKEQIEITIDDKGLMFASGKCLKFY